MAEGETAKAGAVLDPVSRASEVIFGLLMAMTFVGSLSIASAGREEIRTLLAAALGCNLAWGLADAVMYLVGTMTERRRHYTLLLRLRGADAAAGRRLLDDTLPASLSGALPADGLEGLRRRLLDTLVHPPRLRFEDFKGAAAVFLMVVLATFPVVLPFILVSETVLAVRLSQIVALVTLFLAGAALARYSGGSVWRGGLVMSAIGTVLMIAIMALGG